MARPSMAESVAIEERRRRAMELSIQGWTYEEIAKHGNIGYNPDGRNVRATVCNDIKRALEDRKKARDGAALLIVQREIESLDLLARAAWGVLSARHYVVNQGVVVWHNPGVEPPGRTKRGWANVTELKRDIEAEQAAGARPLEDDAPVLKAIESLLKIAERRAKLLGLDAPVKKIVEVEAGDGVDEAIARLMVKLAGGSEAEAAEGASADGFDEDVPTAG